MSAYFGPFRDYTEYIRCSRVHYYAQFFSLLIAVLGLLPVPVYIQQYVRLLRNTYNSHMHHKLKKIYFAQVKQVEYDFSINNISGAQNNVPDALSRFAANQKVIDNIYISLKLHKNRFVCDNNIH